MKRVFLLVACLSLPLALTGCDVLNYIWQHIIGHSFSQVDLATLENEAGNMSGSSISQGSILVNSVVGYKTRNGFYGKLAILAAPSSSSLTFRFTTYNTDSTVKAASTGTTINGNDYCDLETGDTGPSLSPSDVQLKSGAALYPQGAASFYVFP
jgi:hypothetical protein